MRGYESTRARYVLVGEADDGCCGHPWLTWGHELHDDGSDASSDASASASDASASDAGSDGSASDAGSDDGLTATALALGSGATTPGRGGAACARSTIACPTEAADGGDPKSRRRRGASPGADGLMDAGGPRRRKSRRRCGPEAAEAPYAADGFERVELAALTELQVRAARHCS